MFKWFGKLHTLTIIGLIVMAIASTVLVYTYLKYRDWDEVVPSYSQDNCVVETTVEYQKDHRDQKKRIEKKRKYCDLTIAYQYKGKYYEHVIVHVIEDHVKPKTRWVDPSHPEISEETESNYLMGWFFVICGLIAVIVGIVKNRK